MTFAFWHSLLGAGLAFLACFALRRRSASARCWAWRLGLLKGPLALLLAVPVVVATPVVEAATPPPIRETQDGSYRPYRTHTANREPLDPLPWVYAAGVLAVALARLGAARQVHRAMPRVEGVVRPRVVVPDGLSAGEAAMALAHETAHVRRRDPQWSFLADLCCAALWFAPPVWLCARAMRMEAEAACDAVALRETGAAKGDYARLLLAFAGPAPANALGGPARRLARRILMLDKPAKSLPRLAGLALALVGLTTLLPWQAVAQEKPGFNRFTMLAPRPTSLDWAAQVMLDEPGVKAKIGWTADQERGFVEGWKPFERFTHDYGVRMTAMQKTASMKERAEYSKKAMVEQARILREMRLHPWWTPRQTAQLCGLALARFGTALWSDRAVASRLRLTPAQATLLKREDERIVAATDTSRLFPPIVRPARRPPTDVQRKIDEANRAYFLAKPGPARDALFRRVSNLQRPYTPLYGDANGASTKFAAMIKAAWVLRERANDALAKTLSNAQRGTLERLIVDPEAWTHK